MSTPFKGRANLKKRTACFSVFDYFYILAKLLFLLNIQFKVRVLVRHIS